MNKLILLISILSQVLLAVDYVGNTEIGTEKTNLAGIAAGNGKLYPYIIPGTGTRTIVSFSARCTTYSTGYIRGAVFDKDSLLIAQGSDSTELSSGADRTVIQTSFDDASGTPIPTVTVTAGDTILLRLSGDNVYTRYTTVTNGYARFSSPSYLSGYPNKLPTSIAFKTMPNIWIGLESQCQTPVVSAISNIADTVGKVGGVKLSITNSENLDSLHIIQFPAGMTIINNDSINWNGNNTYTNYLCSLSVHACAVALATDTLAFTYTMIWEKINIFSIHSRRTGDSTVYRLDTVDVTIDNVDTLKGIDSVKIAALTAEVIDSTGLSFSFILPSGVDTGIAQLIICDTGSCDTGYFYSLGDIIVPVVDTIYNSVLRQANNWQAFRLYDTINIEGSNFGDSGTASAILINSTGTILAELVSWTSTKVRGTIPYGTPPAYYRSRIRDKYNVLSSNPTKNNIKIIVGRR